MPRPKKAVPAVKRAVYLPQDLDEALREYLHSPLEGCVPMGAFSRFIETLARDFFRRIADKEVEG